MCNYCCVQKQIMCTSYVYNTILMCIPLAEIVQEYKWQTLDSRFGALLTFQFLKLVMLQVQRSNYFFKVKLRILIKFDCYSPIETCMSLTHESERNRRRDKKIFSYSAWQKFRFVSPSRA